MRLTEAFLSHAGAAYRPSGRRKADVLNEVVRCRLAPPGAAATRQERVMQQFSRLLGVVFGNYCLNYVARKKDSKKAELKEVFDTSNNNQLSNYPSTILIIEKEKSTNSLISAS